MIISLAQKVTANEKVRSNRISQAYSKYLAYELSAQSNVTAKTKVLLNLVDKKLSVSNGISVWLLLATSLFCCLILLTGSRWRSGERQICAQIPEPESRPDPPLTGSRPLRALCGSVSATA